MSVRLCLETVRGCFLPECCGGVSSRAGFFTGGKEGLPHDSGNFLTGKDGSFFSGCGNADQ
ncbi:MAG: hypothetical protein EGQ81_09515 [Akkermansia sp.]|nr:hypothetical protein [Akkermansia sp.]